MLGSTLVVVNNTECEQIIELSVDQNSYAFRKQPLVQMFPQVARDSTSMAVPLPFAIDDAHLPGAKDKFTNSEMKFECWYIENPVSKELTKRITLKLGPKAEQDFIIVLRSPTLQRE